MPVPVMGLEELNEKLQRRAIVPIDGRTPAQFAAGHLPGARHIPVAEVARLPELLGPDRTREYVTYGTEGPTMAHMMLCGLHTIGYINSAMFRGGLVAWEAAGLPVERGAASDAA
jgi:rhodanese-related sulfurtransferase